MFEYVPATMAGSATPPPVRLAKSLGLAFLGRTIFESVRLAEVWGPLSQRFLADPGDSGALFDLATLVQMRGDREKSLELQASAIEQCRIYRTTHGAGTGPKILAFMSPGDFMTNTPIDFLLEGSDAELTIFFIDGTLPEPDEAPEHDIAFLAIGQADDDSAALAKLHGAFAAWPRPVVNGRPELIAALSRDGVADRFQGHPQILCPPTRRVERATLAAVGAGDLALEALHAGMGFPLIVRPIGSHAGKGLEKVATPAELAVYVEGHTAEAFFVASFFDYAGADGLYRKLRVVFIDGKPFIAHMAVSARWMVHYLNADMVDPANRQEEAQMMATFDEGFAARHAAAFEALAGAFGLDYFGIDCAETTDGRLVVFEADVAMIVHAMDSAEVYPYKKPAMAKLFAAFVAAMSPAARRGLLAA
ncbi:hypothetical protein [Phenylobacterium sp.]|uniref:ATP-grasp domain-containing protein n=1 Tax=Phenylobacterium sp. TaxID=1871053 RepID=UPI0011F691C7|nr:hypothetical protein [Phenylobacterium sp.]THD70874.1 MAG: tetratricopeptide repeat-containing protein [Phenylobacterium sp.]